MADSDRPVLGLHIDGQIETKQIEVDLSYWEQLRELQVFVYTDMAMLGSRTPLPSLKRPIRLRAVLAAYACELFNLEASEYPRGPQLRHWLEKLADRTRRRVMDSVAQIEQRAELTLNSLTYHNVNVSEMNATIDEALRPLIDEQLRKSAANPAPSSTDAIPSSNREHIDRFILKMAQEGAKVKRKDIWRAAGYKDATEFERFQCGDDRNRAAVSAFRRILGLEPQDFLKLLKPERD
jgi:hypothetical protein